MFDKVVHKSDAEFYSDAEHYWSKIPATVDGMLGGFGFISPIDIAGSRMFLKQLFKSAKAPGRGYALDCGAGIGRISKHLLTGLFDKTDLVEQNPAFLENAENYLGPQLALKIGAFYSVGLQSFEPEKAKYDVIWIQWVLGHLTDSHLVDFLKSCQKGLKPNGLIVIKENVTSSGQLEVDEVDSSVTRTLPELREIFEKAGLKCYRQQKQTNFPKGIYKVYMFALQPSRREDSEMNETPIHVVLEEKLQVEFGSPAEKQGSCDSNKSVDDSEKYRSGESYKFNSENDT